MRLVLPLVLAVFLTSCASDTAALEQVACPDCWHPKPTTQPWQWQLDGRVDTSVRAPVYDIDGFDARDAVVRKLHTRDRRVICYIDVGSWEPGRPDSARFPKSVLGKRLEGFEDERWLDIRRLDVLAPIMRERISLCRAKGFDAVEPDNVDGYANRTGFKLSAADQLRYNAWVANEAHRQRLSVGLKNDTDQVMRLLPWFDFAVVEQCFEFGECKRYSPFVRSSKAVFEAEYELEPREFCAKARRLRFSAIRKRLDLGSWRRTCS